MSERGFYGYLKRTFEGGWVDRLQRPAIRRTVAAAVVAWCVLTGWFLTLIEHDLFWPVLAALVPGIYLIGLLNASTRGVFELPERMLDEWQVAERNAAYRVAYLYGVGAIALLGGVATLTSVSDIHTLVLTFVLFVTTMLLPGLTLAWRLPPEPAARDE